MGSSRATRAEFDVLTFGLSTLFFLPLLAAVVALGSVIARRRLRVAGALWKPSGLESSLLGTYGLLLSFGIFLSGNVHREHAALVHDQSEALAKLYRETDLMPTADAAAVRDAIRAVLAFEVQVAQAADDARSTVEGACGKAYDALWNELTSRARNSATPSSHRSALDHAQRAIALEYRLRFNEAERTPAAFLILLLGGALLVGFLIGFTSGSEGHGWLVPVMFVLLAGCTLVTILDLNDPWHGFLRPSSANYAQLLHAIGDH